MEEGTPNDFSRSGTDPIKISDGDQSNSSQGNQNQSYSWKKELLTIFHEAEQTQ
jgi:hypothetical protein